MEATQPKSMKANEAAAYLNISRSKLYMLLREGSLRSVKIGGSRRFRPCDLDEFLEQNAE